MAQQDLGKGWGGIDSKYSVWFCPVCSANYPVANWTVVTGIINGHVLEGRKCPQGNFEAYQHGDAMKMIPTIASSATLQRNENINQIVLDSQTISTTSTGTATI